MPPPHPLSLTLLHLYSPARSNKEWEREILCVCVFFGSNKKPKKGGEEGRVCSTVVLWRGVCFEKNKNKKQPRRERHTVAPWPGRHAGGGREDFRTTTHTHSPAAMWEVLWFWRTRVPQRLWCGHSTSQKTAAMRSHWSRGWCWAMPLHERL